MRRDVEIIMAQNERDTARLAPRNVVWRGMEAEGLLMGRRHCS